MKATVAAMLARETDRSRFLQQDLGIEKVVALIRTLMELRKVTNAGLSRKLDKDPGYVSRTLAGKMNLTLRTMGDILWALDSSFEVRATPIKAGESEFTRNPAGWAEGWEGTTGTPFWSKWKSSDRMISTLLAGESQRAETSEADRPESKGMVS
jgi:hypothetical protein